MVEFTKLAFPDLETTGLEPIRFVDGTPIAPWHEIIEAGCVLARMDNLDIVAEFERKVRPEHPERMSPAAQEVNGYNETDWQDAVALESAVRDFVSFASGSILVGGNIAFDWGFLLVALAKTGFTKSEVDEHLYYSKRESTSFAAGRLFVPRSPITAGMFGARTIEERLGITPEPKPHRAINGARQMYEIFRRAWELEHRSKR